MAGVAHERDLARLAPDHARALRPHPIGLCFPLALVGDAVLGEVKELAAGGGPVRIAACYPRAVRWMFAGAGAPLPETGVEVLNMRTDTAEQVLAALLKEGDAA